MQPLKMFQSQVSKCSSKLSSSNNKNDITLVGCVWRFYRTRDAAAHNVTLLHHLYEIWAFAIVGFTEKHVHGSDGVKNNINLVTL